MDIIFRPTLDSISSNKYWRLCLSLCNYWWQTVSKIHVAILQSTVHHQWLLLIIFIFIIAQCYPTVWTTFPCAPPQCYFYKKNFVLIATIMQTVRRSWRIKVSPSTISFSLRTCHYFFYNFHGTTIFNAC